MTDITLLYAVRSGFFSQGKALPQRRLPQRHRESIGPARGLQCMASRVVENSHFSGNTCIPRHARLAEDCKITFGL